jgi:hypothetical protein
MIPVGNLFMPAVQVIAVAFNRQASGRVGRRNFDDMLIIVVSMGVVQMPMVQIVHMVAMLDAGMATKLTMGMGVGGMDRVTHWDMSSH